MSSFRTKTAQGLDPIALPHDGFVQCSAIEIDWQDAGPGIAVNDVVTLADIPAGFQVADWTLVTDDIDSNGTPTVVFSFGVLNAAGTALAETWATGITAAQAGGLARAANAASFLSSAAAGRRLGLLATAATATAQLANRRALLMLSLRTV